MTPEQRVREGLMGFKVPSPAWWAVYMAMTARAVAAIGLGRLLKEISRWTAEAK